MSAYSEKLKDPRWQRKRLGVLERAEWKCECCGDDKETLQVHHLIYSKGEPWDAPDDTLECLCESCHESREEFNKFWGGRSLHSTAFCRHFFDRFQDSFDGTLPFKKYPFMLAMARDVTAIVSSADKIPSEEPYKTRASELESNAITIKHVPKENQ